MIKSRKIRLVAVSLVLLCTAGCDQATKHLARTEWTQAGFFKFPGRLVEFVLAENPGAFLSLGDSLPPAVRGVLTGGIGFGLAFLLVHLLKAPSPRWHSFLGLALIWAGGVSNLADRLVRHGLVTDFIVVRIGPLHTGVFNLADLAIVAGMLMFVISLRSSPRNGEIGRPEKAASAEQKSFDPNSLR